MSLSVNVASKLHVAEENQLKRVKFFHFPRHRRGVFVDDVFLIRRDHLRHERVLEAGEKIVRKFTFKPAVPRAAGVDNDELGRAELPRLGAVIKFHPEQTEVVPEAAEGSAMHAQFKIQRMKRIGGMTRRYVLKRRRKIKPAGGSPSGGGAEIGFVAVAEIVTQSNAP